MFGKIHHADRNINTHGAGLRLTISNELVKALNSGMNEEKIYFESEFCKGTRFWFSVNFTENLEGNFIDKGITDNSEMVKSIELNKYNRPSCCPYEKIEQLATYEYLRDKSNNFGTMPKEEENLLLSDKKYVKCTQETCKEILVVDDNPLNLMAASFILNKIGYNVTKAFNGEECIEILEESVKANRQYSLILTDIQMPIMDGLEMSRKITERIKNKELYTIPIVALTAKKVDEKEKEIYRQHGIIESLEKPLNKVEVEKILESVIG